MSKLQRSKPGAARNIGEDIRDLFAHYAPRDGHFDLKALHDEALGLADRIRPRLEAPRSLGADRGRRRRAYATVIRNYAINRRRERAGRQDLLPLYFLWTIQRGCNFRCRYCDDHFGRKYPELPSEGALDTGQAARLLKIMRTRTPSVLFSGGEPTLRGDFPAITRAARDLDYYPIIVNTNGSLLHELLLDPDWRTWLADCDHVVVSLDALDPDVLMGMWGCPRPEIVVRNILLLRELAPAMRFKLMVSTVIQPGFIDHARDVLDLANDLKICFCPMPMNVGPAIEPSLPGNARYQGLVKDILARKRAGYPIAGSERLNERMLLARPLICRNTLKPHIDHDGRLFWPCKAGANIEPLMLRVLDFEDLEVLYARAVKLRNPAGFQTVCGARCNWSQHYSTDAYARLLKNPLAILAEIRSFLRAA